MNSFRHRHRTFIGLPALALLITATGCSSADDTTSTPVPSPDAKVTELCQNLDKVLPAEVDGESREDPEPASALTAGWGNSAIILRCGVEQPPKMVDPKVATGNDPEAIGGGVNGVRWLMETATDGDAGAVRFTSALRRAYVEVTVAKGGNTSTVLVDLASAIKKAIPEGIAN
ncbi:DUF3515 domain-containing protein [Streptomyces dysideae]|uniref:DUF3515 domain-containing protein n=1 Tax=Streptomyces dysideae TaxID=909626 RepID=A0A101UW39_9ACTN|nr:DUF3515 domain-containing protein [Streptomyces dysideae]KUO17943.1 hypothetical protein AQJ91_27940 [Streptomyces dysideae]